MSANKKVTKSKFLSKDMSALVNKSQFANSPPANKGQKRKPVASDEEEDISKLIGMYQANSKKKKIAEVVDEAKETRQKLLEVLRKQLDTRKENNTEFLNKLLDAINRMEADHDVLRDNEQKLEQLTGMFLKCLQQSTTAQTQHLKLLRKMHSTYIKECELIDTEHRTESSKLADELEKDMNKLQEQLISETKRKQNENLRRTIWHAIQNDLVEGLLTRGAMKPDDRPLWFDIYRAFPPTLEPKFAQPKPEIKPIRQIFYPEDVIRAKFHAKGHGYAAVNMLNPSGETQTKKLVQHYEKLKAEGIPEDELVEKAAAAVGVERQQSQEAPRNPKNPDSATAQVLKEADLKNIFTDDKK